MRFALRLIVVTAFALASVASAPPVPGDGPPGADAGNTGGVDAGPDAPVSPVAIFPWAPFALGIGGSVDMLASVYDEEGYWLINQPGQPVIVEWSSSDDAVATVDDYGRVRAVGAGTAVVSATVSDASTGAPSVQGASTSVELTVAGRNMAALRLEPERVAIGTNAEYAFAVSASDGTGAPTTVECTSPVAWFDSDVLSWSYDSTLGAERVVVTGMSQGYTLLYLECDGVASSPVIVEVKDRVVIPQPTTSQSSDFGHRPSLAFSGSRIGLSSYDNQNRTLLFTLFDSAWQSEVLDGEGSYGAFSRVVFDPLNDDRPVVCATEVTTETRLSCWTKNGQGFWAKQVLAEPVDEDATFEMERGGEGALYVLYRQGGTLKLATSAAADRTTWTHDLVAYDVTEAALAIAPDGLPRVAYQRQGVASYGVPGPSGAASEVIDDSTGAPGTGIRLRIGSNNRPQVVYTKNGNLVYAIKIAGQWFTEVVDNISVGSEIGFDLNGWDEPRVSYFDAQANTLRYSWRSRRGAWRISRPIDGEGLGDSSAILIDDYQRAHIAYHASSDGTVGYYVEPAWLDYALPPDTSVDDLANTNVAAQPVCGDEVLTANEQCDDGNVFDGDGCDANCTFSGCGNSVVTDGEECDDGNRAHGDGCNGDCRVEDIAVTSGSSFSCALDANGHVTCWGNNDFGQASPPASAVFSQIDAGATHVCGVLASGFLGCWGSNSRGEASAPDGTFLQVSGGNEYTCGVRTDGTAQCWGYGPGGQTTPPDGQFVQVSAGGEQACGLRPEGTVECWGQVGDLPPPGAPPPPPPPSPEGTFLQVSAGIQHACGVTTGFTVECWGSDAFGQASPPSGNFLQVSTFDRHTCAVTTAETAVCWGASTQGQSLPPSGSFTQVSVGNIHTCGLRPDGTTRCWGYNGDGQSSPP